MALTMERTCKQSRWWRAYAILAVGFPLVMLASEPTLSDVGVNWQTLRAFYLLLAPLGVLGYAFGFRLISVSFWRVYAVLFSIESMLRCTRFIWVKAQPVLQSPARDHDFDKAVIAVALFSFTCVALLRHAELVKGGTRRGPNLSKIFS